MFIFAWLLIPETKGPSLERMNDLFGVAELVKNIEEEGKVEHAHAPPAKICFDGKETSKQRIRRMSMSLETRRIKRRLRRKSNGGRCDSEGNEARRQYFGVEVVTIWDLRKQPLGFEEFKVRYFVFEIFW
jgi:hypothetical protein